MRTRMSARKLSKDGVQNILRGEKGSNRLIIIFTYKNYEGGKVLEHMHRGKALERKWGGKE